MKTTLEVAHLLHPVQFDRMDMQLSTLLTNEDWKIVSTFKDDRIGDVEIFKNTNFGKPDLAPVWEYYGSVPAQCVRGYRKQDVEPEAEPRKAPAKG